MHLWRYIVPAVFCVGAASAQPVVAPADLLAPSRADLGRAYLRLERILSTAEPSDPVAANRAFDAATMRFFSGNFRAVIADVDALTASAMGDTAPPEAREAMSLGVRITPEVWRQGPVRVELGRLYAATASITGPVRVLAVAPDGSSLELARVDWTPATTRATLDVDPRVIQTALEAPEGRRAIVVEASGAGIEQGAWTIARESLDDARAALRARLAAIRGRDPALDGSWHACAARAERLTDSDSSGDTFRLVADLVALRDQVIAEVESLERGVDPYRRQAGDRWMAVALGEASIPLRVHAPAQAMADDPMPLIIALHGAGGDEHMFMEGYGGGAIKRLADERGFIVASPATMLAASPRAFDRLVDQLSAWYAIDPDRIYVLGHSMGAGVAGSLARSRVDRIAGVAQIAGGFRWSTGAAPSLVIGAELDPIVPGRRMQEGAEAAQKAGVDVEFRMIQGRGHTLVVGEQLRPCVDWLLARRLAPR